MLAVVVGIVSGRCGSDEATSFPSRATYSNEEVEGAFRAAGYPLVPRAAHAPGVAILSVERSDPEISVNLSTDAEQGRVWDDIKEADEYNENVFAARRGNVLVLVLEAPIGADTRGRILKILESLPDRGPNVAELS
jgi:hypothetical protein